MTAVTHSNYYDNALSSLQNDTQKYYGNASSDAASYSHTIS